MFINSINFLLTCPNCSVGPLMIESDFMHCKNCMATYPILLGRPVLLRHDNSLFNISEYLNEYPSITRNNFLLRFIPSISANLSVRRKMKHLRSLLDERGASVVLIVGAGKQRSWLTPLLCERVSHKIIYTDIDKGADVDIFCDGHDLPFIDNAVDAVITTAVLEHVLYPEKVASEISRVVKVGGYLYSEIPFMQQVHEGAYDFTRYTLSGHRRIFNRFMEIDVGMVAGPGTALAWAIENFILSFFDNIIISRIVKICSRLGLFWIKYFDYILVHRPGAMDGASCTYLFGKKIEGKIEDSKIINDYVGLKYTNHL